MMAFTVIKKDDNTLYEVYNVSYNKAGYPHFLIYKDGQWLSMSAKHFRPTTLEDYGVEIESRQIFDFEAI